MPTTRPPNRGDQNTATGSRLTQNSRDAMYWGGHVDASRIKVFPLARRQRLDGHAARCRGQHLVQDRLHDERSDNQQWLDNSRTSARLHHWSRPQAVPGIGPAGRYAAEWRSMAGVGLRSRRRRRHACSAGPASALREDRAGRRPDTGYGRRVPHLEHALRLCLSGAGYRSQRQYRVSVAFGDSNYASTTVGYLGDFVVYYVEASDVTLTFTQNDNSTPPKVIVDSAGNPHPVHPLRRLLLGAHSGRMAPSVCSQGYAVKLVNPAVSTNCTTAPGCTFRPTTSSGGGQRCRGPTEAQPARMRRSTLTQSLQLRWRGFEGRGLGLVLLR